MSGAAAGAFIAGKIIGAAGLVYSGAQTAIGYRAAARAKRLEAEHVQETTEWDQMRILDEGRRLMATQRSMYGQAGVRLEGTPTDVMEETRREVLLEQMNRAATGAFERQALLAERKSLRRAGRAAETSGVLAGIGSIFSF